MGKAKIMAKYRLDGRMGALLFMFILLFCAVAILGDFSFIINNVFELTGVVFSSATAETLVRIVVPVFGVILFLLVASPLRLGFERWFLLTAKGEKPKFREAFFYFSPKGIRKSIAAFIFCAVRKTAALALFLFPSACLFGVLYFSFGEGEISLYISYALLGFSLTLLLTGLSFYFYYTSRYFAYYSIIVSNEVIKPAYALDRSREITEGAYGKICFFRLSFLPWMFLCLLIFPAFYVWGYYKESKAMLSLRNDLIGT